MAGEASITFVGNVGADPEVRFMPNGDAQSSMSVAVTRRKKENNEWKDDTTTWYRCTAWGKKAELLAESVKKGNRVIVVGRFEVATYEKDGETRSAPTVTIDDFGIVPRMNVQSNTPKSHTTDGSPW